MSADRPGPLRWLWYALGGGLGPRYREWVLHDTTARTWWLRQLVRALVQALPVALVLWLLIPGSPWIRLLAVGGGVFVAGIYVVAFLDEAVEHRARKAGYPPGFARDVRDAAHRPERDAEAARYAERYRRPDAAPPSGPETSPAPWSGWPTGSSGNPPGYPSGPP